jgi:hypothetical protein
MTSPPQTEVLVMLKRFRSATPSDPRTISNCWPAPSILASEQTQQWLADNLANDPTPYGTNAWRRIFWKVILERIEQGISELSEVGHLLPFLQNACE